MKSKKLLTYSKKAKFTKISKNNDEIFNSLPDEDTSVTDLYAKTIESCKKSFDMGNHQDRMHLTSNQINQQQTGNENSKPFLPRECTNLNNHVSLLKAPVTNSKKWSNNRKIKNNTKSSEKLGRNSTLCEGGNRLFENIIGECSPIAKKSNDRKDFQRVTPGSLNTLKQEKPRNKVEKWLEKTDGFSFEIDPSAVVEPSKGNYIMERHDVEVDSNSSVSEQSDISHVRNLVLKLPDIKEIVTESRIKPVLVKKRRKNNSSVSEPSDISYVSNVVLKSPDIKEIITETRIKPVHTKKRRKKRKCICMPKTKRKALPFVSQKMNAPKKVSRIDGKVLKMKINTVHHTVKLKKDGELTFRKESSFKYDLRNKVKTAEKVQLQTNTQKDKNEKNIEILEKDKTEIFDVETVENVDNNEDCEILQKRNKEILDKEGREIVIEEETSDVSDLELAQQYEEELTEKKNDYVEENGDTPPSTFPVNESNPSKRKLFTSKRTLDLHENDELKIEDNSSDEVSTCFLLKSSSDYFTHVGGVHNSTTMESDSGDTDYLTKWNDMGSDSDISDS